MAASNVGADVDQSTDVIVVGCGMAGLCAGISAAESGGNVIILEKAPRNNRGGQTQYTESFRIPTADIDLDLDFHYPTYDANDYYQDILRLSDGKADPDLASTVTQNAAETFEWLTSHLAKHGFEWQTAPLRTMYGSGRVWHDGTQLVDALVRVAEAFGVEIIYQAEARSIISTDRRRVAGIEAIVDGTPMTLGSGAVIIACGSYESSPEKRTRYYGGPYEEMTVRGVRYNTGEAIDMAIDIGAKTEGQWSGAHITVIDAGSPTYEGGQTLISGYQFGLMLNHDGERFVDEGEDFRAHTYAKFGRAVFEQPYNEAFVIQDAETDQYVFHSGPSDPVTAETIDELVARLDIENQERAIQTVHSFNERCDPDAELDTQNLDGNAATGIEPPKSNWAKRLDAPPFVAYPITGGITFSYGGLAQTTDAKVLDTSLNPIPGLYAAGNATGGLFYTNYPGGTALMNAAVYGRLAGGNAVAEVTSSPP